LKTYFTYVILVLLSVKFLATDYDVIMQFHCKVETDTASDATLKMA